MEGGKKEELNVPVKINNNHTEAARSGRTISPPSSAGPKNVKKGFQGLVNLLSAPRRVELILWSLDNRSIIQWETEEAVSSFHIKSIKQHARRAVKATTSCPPPVAV